jgi:hypothetical protein
VKILWQGSPSAGCVQGSASPGCPDLHTKPERMRIKHTATVGWVSVAVIHGTYIGYLETEIAVCPFHKYIPLTSRFIFLKFIFCILVNLKDDYNIQNNINENGETGQ